MSGVCGWFRHPKGIGSDYSVIARMARVLSRQNSGQPKILSSPWGAVAACASSGAAVFRDPRRLVAVWGELRFSDVRLQALASARGPAEALCRGYEERGTGILEDVTGSFALALLDAAGEALLAVDRMGTRPLCYALTNGALVFGSRLDVIDQYPGALRQVSPQALYSYMYFHVVPAPTSIYHGRYRLAPGTCLKFRHGAMEVVPYWQMRFEEQETRPFSELKADFIHALRQSVAKLAAQGSVGAFLSGGTDSSTIAGMLRSVSGDAPRTYSIGFDAPGFDEVGYARIAARHFGARHHEYYVTPNDVVDAVPKIAAIHDQPFGNSSSVPTFYCAKLAKADGIEVMLGGDGGDELFGGNSRYAVQYLFSLYSDLPKRLRSGLLEPVAFALPQVLAGKIQRYMRSAAMPMPARYDKYNLLEHFGPESIFTRDFLSQVDADEPRCSMASAYRQAQAQSLINRMLALDLKYTIADNDLPKVSRSCELAGVEAGFPMLDDAVVTFSARLAPNLKLKGTRLRYFFKEALRDFLPPEILKKKKHGFGLPFGPWLQTHNDLRQLAYDSLSDLKRRKIVRGILLDELMSVHLNRHAGYFSTMVWILMMLEQWFARSPSENRSDSLDEHMTARSTAI